jgi:hypothetical protein
MVGGTGAADLVSEIRISGLLGEDADAAGLASEIGADDLARDPGGGTPAVDAPVVRGVLLGPCVSVMAAIVDGIWLLDTEMASLLTGVSTRRRACQRKPSTSALRVGNRLVGLAWRFAISSTGRLRR